MRTIDEYFTRVRQLVQSIADIHAERYEVCSESLSRQLFRILGQSQFNGIDHVRNRTIRCCCLESESPVNLWFEIDSRSFW
jgi:hypothetical protein